MFESLADRLSKSFSFLRGRKELNEENIEEGLSQVRQALLDADVNFKVVGNVVERVRARILGADRIGGVDASEQFVHAFHQELIELLGPEDATLNMASSPPTVILMAGLQGAGKTTTCAKLARHLREKHKKRPLLVAADVKRPAAVEQLKVLGRQIDVPVFASEGDTPPEVCRKGLALARVQGNDVVILDTAGRLHIDDEMMAEVAAIAKVTKPHNQVLVVDAMTGQDAVQSAQAFDERLSLTGVILTKLDGDARGGAALSLKAVTGLPVLFAGVGEKIEDLDPFHPERMAGRILGMGDVVGLVERAQETIDEDEAQRSFEKMILGDFTLEDMLGQLRMMRKLGPMKKVLGMLPGMGQLGDLDVDDGQMNRLEALFTSMTPRERLQPQTLDMSRRRRVAKGSGQEVGAVNELLKRFKGMRQLMKQMNKMGLGSMFGSKAKKQALAGLSPTGETLESGPGLGERLAGLGGLGGLGRGAAGAGAGAGADAPGGMGGLGGLFGGGGAGMGAGPGGGPGMRPKGSSATRKKSSKRKDKKKPKKSRRKK